MRRGQPSHICLSLEGWHQNSVGIKESQVTEIYASIEDRASVESAAKERPIGRGEANPTRMAEWHDVRQAAPDDPQVGQRKLAETADAERCREWMLEIIVDKCEDGHGIRSAADEIAGRRIDREDSCVSHRAVDARD